MDTTIKITGNHSVTLANSPWGERGDFVDAATYLDSHIHQNRATSLAAVLRSDADRLLFVQLALADAAAFGTVDLDPDWWKTFYDAATRPMDAAFDLLLEEAIDRIEKHDDDDRAPARVEFIEQDATVGRALLLLRSVRESLPDSIFPMSGSAH